MIMRQLEAGHRADKNLSWTVVPLIEALQFCHFSCFCFSTYLTLTWLLARGLLIPTCLLAGFLTYDGGRRRSYCKERLF